MLSLSLYLSLSLTLSPLSSTPPPSLSLYLSISFSLSNLHYKLINWLVRRNHGFPPGSMSSILTLTGANVMYRLRQRSWSTRSVSVCQTPFYPHLAACKTCKMSLVTDPRDSPVATLDVKILINIPPGTL